MDTLQQLRQARAGLAWLYEPTDPRLHHLTRGRGPVQALADLTHQAPPLHGLRAELAHLSAQRLWVGATTAVESARREQTRIIIPEDPHWPAGLADLATTDPEAVGRPAVLCLWVLGHLPPGALDRSVTVTGARAATSYGMHDAAGLGHDLAGRGWTVLSSGGYGIEAAAHRGALAAGGVTVAVLPAGLSRPHPAGNQDLFDAITRIGMLISAYPPDAQPRRHRHVANARLLAGLTRGTVLVEATLRSRALASLAQAAALGRAAMVVPGPVTSAVSAGGHQALRTGARIRLVTGVRDVLADLETAAGGASS